MSAKSGRSGPTPFGYQRDGNKLVRDPSESEIRLKIFELFLIHQRKKTVADILNSEGFRTRAGSEFSGQTISRLLADKIVLGERNVVDQIVPNSLFEKCQKILKRQSEKGGATRLPNHPFAGIAFCGCGGKMYVPTGSRKYVCQDCKSKISQRDLEKIFVETVIDHLEQKATKSKLLSPFKEWSILPLRVKIDLTQILASRLDVTNKKVTITLFNIYT